MSGTDMLTPDMVYDAFGLTAEEREHAEALRRRREIIDKIRREQLVQLKASIRVTAQRFQHALRTAAAGVRKMVSVLNRIKRDEIKARRRKKAHARSVRNQPSSPLPFYSRHHGAHNRKRNKHGRTGVAR